MKRIRCGLLALAAIGFVLTARAETPMREYSLELHRQALAATLKEFSRQTGLQIGFFPNNSSEENIVVGPLSGRYTAESALTELLASSGLTFQRVNERTIAVNAVKTQTRGFTLLGAERQIDFDIESQSLTNALNEWAQQTGLKIIYPAVELTDRFVTPGLRGRSTPQSALLQLLAGTSLIHDVVNERTVAIRERLQRAPSITGSQSADKKGLKPRLRLASLNQAGDLSDSAVSAQPGARTRRTDESTAERRGIDRLEEILVTGTHLRGTSSPSQLISIDRAEIEKTGFTTVEALIESLPQNFAEISPGGRFATEGGSNLSRVNNDRVSSINLRGLGAQSTLTLIDGTRQAGSIGGRVFDVSVIPLTMLERVEIVTGARSAIYGADAVAGVANLVTRREYDGLQTQVSYGGTESGGERLQVSQLGGLKFDNGGFAVGYDYSRDWPFDLADVGMLSKEPIVTAGGLRETSLQVQAPSWRHSALLSGHYSPSTGIDVYGNALYTYKRFESEERQLRSGAPAETVFSTKHPSRFYSATAGARISLSPTWGLRITGTSSTNDIEEAPSTSVFVTATSRTNTTLLRHDKTNVSSLSAVADGVLFRVRGVSPRLAIGAEAREEEFRGWQAINGVAAPENDGDRTVRSVFSELLLPLVENGASTFMRQLELSVAGRYDDYNDFGSTLNPQLGILWEPFDGVRLRAGYSEAFRAPALVELAPDNNSAFVASVTDPRSTTGRTPLLILRGENPDLGPETANSLNFGFEFQPAAFPTTSVSISYFDVEYIDRIEVPAISFGDQQAALINEVRFSQLVDRTPDAAAVQAIVSALPRFTNLTATPFNRSSQNILAVFPGLAVFDDRRNNIAIDKITGLDLHFTSAATTSAGDLTYGLNATYTLEHERNITETSPSFGLINEVGKPADFRMRANVGWDAGPYGVFAFVNYIDGYSNPYSTPTSKIGSWITMDATLRIDFSELSRSAPLAGLIGTLSVDNIFDSAPPRYSNSAFGVLYDSANADPFGRFVSLRIVKEW